MPEIDMSEVARTIDTMLNGASGGQETGFVLLTFPFAGGGRCQYVSSAHPDDVVVLLKEQIKRLEAMPDKRSS